MVLKFLIFNIVTFLLTKLQIVLKFQHVFSWMSFSYSTIPSQMPRCIPSSCLLGSCLWQFPSLSLFFITLNVLKSTNLVFCRTCLNLGFSDVLIIALELRISGKNITDECPFHMSCWEPMILTWCCWLRYCLSDVSIVKLWFFPYQFFILWKQVTESSSSSKEGS